jgi:serine protease Do
MTKLLAHRTASWALALALGIPFATLAKDNNTPAKFKLDASPINRDARSGNSYSSVIRRASPSVVNIYSTKTVRSSRFHQFFDDPFFDRFFGDGTPHGGQRGPNNFKAESLGSGVIVTEDGYILTNNHVVEGADADGVKVALGDGKQKLSAKVVGTDPQTDIAVLKVDGKDLPTITIADSDKLEVGDIVLAIGNPFNVGQSVTQGIISGLGRSGNENFRMADYEDFIQTDAAINPGNSGGALVDAEGRLIGINQSIASPTRSSAGVGFAVPVNLAKLVMERLLADGTVKRGYLGVMIQPVTPELAKAFNLPDTRGALVGGVSPNTPAAEAGIKEGDVIIAVNGRQAADSQHARLMISQILPGTKVPLSVLRDGKEKTVTATLGTLPTEEGALLGAAKSVDKNEHDALDGVEVADLRTEAQREFSIPDQIRGALVTNVDPDSNAYEAGLRPGNVILEIDRTPVANADDAVKLSEKAQGNHLLLRVWGRMGESSGSRFLPVDNTKKK